MSLRINSARSQDRCFGVAWDGIFQSLFICSSIDCEAEALMPLTICDARREGDRHAPQSSIVRLLFSSQEPFGVLSVLTNLSRHNTLGDSKCFDLKQKCPRK